ncbi:hypothetical protein BCR33DRAFT_739694 [Rhizoclosmatium globosum]|uniref:BZIP domain-containing protein n=1 Tax=Rhizoclosmatium globosum TaxID=329046 RepID=A0A1Y2C3X2_9FUNG|nr:hypothetical protein BCR33DRAFT_739694 [Rhizoclosmatium globosum]|eukprot:ORY41701.1 hypothetical protein BCR33DRAFT_739694 [Rhizoclosmatium globosum]
MRASSASESSIAEEGSQFGSASAESQSAHGSPVGELQGSSGPQGSVEPERRKPGRKPLTSDPASRRTAQTRAAQRAFRERKAAAFAALEQRVSELEVLLSISREETDVLKSHNERLMQENSRLSEQIHKYQHQQQPQQPLSLLHEQKPQPTEVVTPLGNSSSERQQYWNTVS